MSGKYFYKKFEKGKEEIKKFFVIKIVCCSDLVFVFCC